MQDVKEIVPKLEIEKAKNSIMPKVLYLRLIKFFE